MLLSDIGVIFNVILPADTEMANNLLCNPNYAELIVGTINGYHD